MESIIQLITVLVIFVLVLAATYLTTKWVGGFQKSRQKGTNIELLDCVGLAPNQFLQLVKAGQKYLLIGVSKDRMTLLAEIPQEMVEVDEGDTAQNNVESFQKLLNAAKNKLHGK